MERCIFCEIVKGTSPCYKVFEDDRFMAFLDIFPRVKGQTLVIPKKHYRWVYEVDDFKRYWEAVLKVTKKIQKNMKPDFISYVTYGMDVSHAHVHIMPRHYGERQILPGELALKKEELLRIQHLINGV
jgi:histidine triad (HIT) family protein